jgi:hypothetical protein
MAKGASLRARRPASNSEKNFASTCIDYILEEARPQRDPAPRRRPARQGKNIEAIVDAAIRTAERDREP